MGRLSLGLWSEKFDFFAKKKEPGASERDPDKALSIGAQRYQPVRIWTLAGHVVLSVEAQPHQERAKFLSVWSRRVLPHA